MVRGGSEPALALRGVEVRYGGRVTLAVPDLTVGRAETVAMMGPNGAGKSTLLHVAALLRWPEAGEVRIGGERAARRAERALRRRTAMVLQAPLLFDVPVLANAASGLRFRGVGRREAERRAGDWLERFGVGHLAGRNARALSGGEAQRVSLARAFATEPELLLLDEPFSGLDAPTRTALVPELAALLGETGTAALVATHDRGEAAVLADRLAVLIGGQIVRIGPTENVLGAPGSDEVGAVVGFGLGSGGREEVQSGRGADRGRYA
jgi:ABC-type sugar transport system ATPase subunit